MEYDNEENGFISVPAPEFGAIFMSNIATKRSCFKHKVFGLSSSMTNFVKEVKKGMILFLFEYERRQLFGVYRAISDGGMNIVPHAFSSSGKQFSAQVRFVPIWYCSPLSEDEFGDAIRENYFSARKFHFGLSDEQVHRLLRLFSSRKLKNKLPPRELTTGVSNGIDEDHIMVNNKSYTASGGFDIKCSNADLRCALSRGYPRSFHGVKRIADDMFSIEHREKDEDIVDSAEHLYYNDKKRRIGYDEALLRDNAAEDKLHVHSLTEELGFSGDDEWSSLNGRVKREHKINTNYTPALSNYMEDSDLRRTVHDANLVVRNQIVKENIMDSNFGLGRSNEHNGKPSDNDRTRLGTHYAGFLRNNHVDKAHSMDNSHEPSFSRKNKSDPFWNIGTASDDWPSSLDDRVGGKKSHLDPDINSTIVSERFVNSPYNKKGMRKDGRLFRRDISGNESKFRTGHRREFDHQEATDDVSFLSRRKGANEKCVDRFLIPAASNGNSAYAGDVGRQMAEVGTYPMHDFDGLVPGTENFQRPLTEPDCTVYSPMKKRTSGYSTKFLAEAEFPQSTEGQNLGPSCSKFHDATITRVMPYKDELPNSCYGHTETYEVEQGSNIVRMPPSSNVYRENNFASSKGISSPYSHPEFTKRGLESASEGGKMVLLSHNGFIAPPLNVGISESVEPNRSGSFGYRTAITPRASIVPQLTRDDINEGETWRYSSQAALGSIVRDSFSGNYQCADEELGDGHVIWQGSDATHVGRRSRSPNTSWLLQGNVLTNLDYANRPGADIVNDEYENNRLTNVVHSDSRNSRKSVFSRLSLAPKVRKLREQEVDHRMSFDDHYMDTTVNEIMDLLYEDQNIVPKKPLNRKPFIRKVGGGETNRSGKHAAVVKNDAEQSGDSMTRVLRESANEVLEETMNHILAETRMVDFKRRRETNRASEQTNVKLNIEEKTNANDEYRVLQNAQGNSSQTAMSKDSADKPFKRRKLVRPAFDENSCRSDLNHQLPCQTLGSDSSEFQPAL